MGKVFVIAVSGVAFKGEKQLHQTELSILDGIDCQDDFADYVTEPLRSKLDSGFMSFKYNEDEAELYVIVEYQTNEDLNEEELQELGEYTQGQWSDGIGEGFEQESCREIDGEEIMISPWYGGQQVNVVQES